MRRPIAKLSPISRRFPAKAARKKRPLSCETLESRTLLSADLGASAAATFAGEGAAFDSTAAPATAAVSTAGPQMVSGISEGDLTGDGRVNADDIDMLCGALRDGAAGAFDLTGDAIVDKADMDYLIEGILGTHYGDANLDSQVNVIDFATWNFYRFQAGQGWAGGDFSCDGVTDVRDFNVWNQNKNLSPIGSLSATDTGAADQLAVPEQTSPDSATFATNLGTSQSSEKPGDFNDDGDVDATDIDMLAAGLRTGNVVPDYDLDENGVVDRGDMDELIWGVIGTQYGDANLDRDVNVGDFALWQAHQFTSEVGWSSGDFNGDGVNDVSDYNVWNSNRSFSSPTALSSGNVNTDTVQPSVEDQVQTRFAEVQQTAAEEQPSRDILQPLAKKPTPFRAAATGAKVTPRSSAFADDRAFTRLRRISLRF